MMEFGVSGWGSCVSQGFTYENNDEVWKENES